ncbi:MAG: hypothetical protein R2755_33750 [Acidimicrobiales bacterium]
MEVQEVGERYGVGSAERAQGAQVGVVAGPGAQQPRCVQRQAHGAAEHGHAQGARAGRSLPTDHRAQHQRHRAHQHRHHGGRGQRGQRRHLQRHRGDRGRQRGAALEVGEGLQPAGGGERAHHPGQQGVEGERPPLAGHQRVVGQRVGGVGQHHRRLGPAVRTEAAEAPHAVQPHGQAADDEQRAQQVGGAEHDQTGQAQQAEGGGRRRVRADAHVPPARPAEPQQVPGATGEGHELADGGHRPGQQVPAAEQQHQGEHQHGDHVLGLGAGAAAADPLAQRVAEGGVGVGPADLAAEEAGHPGRAAHLQAAQLEVGDLAQVLARPTLGGDRADPAGVPRPRREHLPGLAEATGQHRDHDLEQREHRLLHELAEQVEPAVVGQHHAQAVTGLQPAAIVGPALAERLEVPDPGVRRHQHPGAGQVGAPAEVGVLAVVGDGLVEAAEGPQQVGPDEEAGARHVEHVADAVVLLLVELVALTERERGTEAVGAHADGEERLGLIPAHELGADDAGVGAVGLLHQQAHGVGGQGHVVVAEQEERGTLDHRQGVVDRGAGAGVALEAAHIRLRSDLGDAMGRVAVTVGVEDEDRQVGVVLVDQ